MWRQITCHDDISKVLSSHHWCINHHRSHSISLSISIMTVFDLVAVVWVCLIDDNVNQFSKEGKSLIVTETYLSDKLLTRFSQLLVSSGWSICVKIYIKATTSCVRTVNTSRLDGLVWCCTVFLTIIFHFIHWIRHLLSQFTLHLSVVNKSCISIIFFCENVVIKQSVFVQYYLFIVVTEINDWNECISESCLDIWVTSFFLHISLLSVNKSIQSHLLWADILIFWFSQINLVLILLFVTLTFHHMLLSSLSHFLFFLFSNTHLSSLQSQSRATIITDLLICALDLTDDLRLSVGWAGLVITIQKCQSEVSLHHQWKICCLLFTSSERWTSICWSWDISIIDCSSKAQRSFH